MNSFKCCALIYYYVKALLALYSGQNCGGREAAHKWLLATQKSQQAWQLCWQLMQKEKVGIFLTMLIMPCSDHLTFMDTKGTCKSLHNLFAKSYKDI